MDFKDNIKRIREDNSVSFVDLAKEFGKSEAAIRAWELGRSKPDADTLIGLAKYFNCTTDYLLGLSSHPSRDEQAHYTEAIEAFAQLVETEYENPGDIFSNLTTVFRAFSQISDLKKRDQLPSLVDAMAQMSDAVEKETANLDEKPTTFNNYSSALRVFTAGRMMTELKLADYYSELERLLTSECLKKADKAERDMIAQMGELSLQSYSKGSGEKYQAILRQLGADERTAKRIADGTIFDTED